MCIRDSFIGENVVIQNSVIGPFVSLEEGVHIKDSRINKSIVQAHSIVKNARIENSLLGKSVNYNEKARDISIGDFSTH